MKERLNTGLTEIDEKLNGLKVGCVYIVAGRVAEGKTSFGAALCERLGNQALLISFEPVYTCQNMVGGFTDFEELTRHLINDFMCDSKGRSRNESRLKLIVIDDFERIICSNGRKLTSSYRESFCILEGLAQGFEVCIVVTVRLKHSSSAFNPLPPKLNQLYNHKTQLLFSTGVFLIYRPEFYAEEPEDALKALFYEKNNPDPMDLTFKWETLEKTITIPHVNN